MQYAPIIDTVFLCGLLIASLHWFPWRRLLGADLHRLLTYSLGVSVILGVPTLLYLRYQPDAAGTVLAMFWAAGLAAGAATIGAWAVDMMIEAMHLRRDNEDARNERANRRQD